MTTDTQLTPPVNPVTVGQVAAFEAGYAEAEAELEQARADLAKLRDAILGGRREGFAAACADSGGVEFLVAYAARIRDRWLRVSASGCGCGKPRKAQRLRHMHTRYSAKWR